MNRIILLLSFLLAFTTSLSATARDSLFENDVGISQEALADSISRQTNLRPAEVKGLIALLNQQFQVAPGKRIPISGYLYSSGMNAALFLDHDTWIFDATIADPNTGRLVKIPRLFLCDFKNGGLKIELAYKWMFTFIPAGIDVNLLNGGVFGRGIGVVFDPLLGFEASWMQGQNRAADIFHVAIKLGLGGGIVFPQMQFKLRRVYAGMGEPTPLSPAESAEAAE